MIIGKVARPSIPPMEEGTYAGICVASYYIGEQETQYNGKTRYVRQVLCTFEFPTEIIEIDGEQKPRQLSRTFTASVSKKGSLRKLVSSLMGRSYSDDEFREFDTNSLLGRSALFEIQLNESKEYANIAGCMSLPKGMPQPTTASELLTFDVEEWNDEQFGKLPEWVQERIKKSTEYKQQHAPDTVVDFPEAPKATVQPVPEEECPI
jgi:hypothetical protein